MHVLDEQVSQIFLSSSQFPVSTARLKSREEQATQNVLSNAQITHKKMSKVLTSSKPRNQGAEDDVKHLRGNTQKRKHKRNHGNLNCRIAVYDMLKCTKYQAKNYDKVDKAESGEIAEVDRSMKYNCVESVNVDVSSLSSELVNPEIRGFDGDSEFEINHGDNKMISTITCSGADYNGYGKSCQMEDFVNLISEKPAPEEWNIPQTSDQNRGNEVKLLRDWRWNGHRDIVIKYPPLKKRLRRWRGDHAIT